MPPRRVNHGTSARSQHNRLMETRKLEKSRARGEREADLINKSKELFADAQNLDSAIKAFDNVNITNDDIVDQEFLKLRKFATEEYLARRNDARYGEGKPLCKLPGSVEFPKSDNCEAPTLPEDFDPEKEVLAWLLVPAAPIASNNVTTSPGECAVGTDEDSEGEAEGQRDHVYFRIPAVIANQIAIVLALLRMRIQETKANFPDRRFLNDTANPVPDTRFEETVLLHTYYRKLFEAFYFNLQLYAEEDKISEGFLANGAMVYLRDKMPLVLHDFFCREGILGTDSSIQDRAFYAMNTKFPYKVDLMDFLPKYLSELYCGIMYTVDLLRFDEDIRDNPDEFHSFEDFRWPLDGFTSFFEKHFPQRCHAEAYAEYLADIGVRKSNKRKRTNTNAANSSTEGTRKSARTGGSSRTRTK